MQAINAHHLPASDSLGGRAHSESTPTLLFLLKLPSWPQLVSKLFFETHATLTSCQEKAIRTSQRWRATLKLRASTHAIGQGRPIRLRARWSPSLGAINHQTQKNSSKEVFGSRLGEKNASKVAMCTSNISMTQKEKNSEKKSRPAVERPKPPALQQGKRGKFFPLMDL